MAILYLPHKLGSMLKKLQETEAELSLGLRMARQSNGYSQAFMAKKLNITQQAYSKIEKCPTNASLRRLIEVCDLLNFSMTAFMITHLHSGRVNGHSVLETHHYEAKVTDCHSCISDIRFQLAELASGVKALNGRKKILGFGQDM